MLVEIDWSASGPGGSGGGSGASASTPMLTVGVVTASGGIGRAGESEIRAHLRLARSHLFSAARLALRQPR